MRLMKLLCVPVLLAASLAVTAPSHGAEVTLKAIAAWPKSFPLVSLGFLRFVKMANEAGKGEFKIVHIGGPEIVLPGDLVYLADGPYTVERGYGWNWEGDFNNWRPELTTMQKVGQSGVWQTKLTLPNGKYRYRFVVDGQWQQDPYNEQTEMNPYGELNSIFEVK